MKKSFYLIILLLLTSNIFSQQGAEKILLIRDVPGQAVLLKDGWKYHPGDNPDWSKPDIDESQWRSIDPTKDIHDIPELWKNNIGWFRFHFNVDSVLALEEMAILIEQTGASEIFVNGKRVAWPGEISDNPEKIQASTPVFGSFTGVRLNRPADQVLAVRFAIQKNIPYIVFASRPNRAISIRIMETKDVEPYFHSNITSYFDFLRTGAYFLLSILCFVLFWFDTSQKANLYFFLYGLFSAVWSMMVGLVYNHIDPAAMRMYFFIAITIGLVLSWLFFLSAVYKSLNQQRSIIYWVLIAAGIISLVLLFMNYRHGFDFAAIYFNLLVFLDCVRVTMLARRRKQRGANIILAGAIAYILCYLLYYAIQHGYLPAGSHWIYGHFAFNAALLVIPVAITVFLAFKSSSKNHEIKVATN